jgi:hypothetical protein
MDIEKGKLWPGMGRVAMEVQDAFGKIPQDKDCAATNDSDEQSTVTTTRRSSVSYDATLSASWPAASSSPTTSLSSCFP